MKLIRLASPLFLFALFGAMAGTALADSPAATANERCAVCGMQVSPYPNWIAHMVFKDGSQVFFDGPKDMFVYFFDLGTYRPQGKASDIEQMYVKEYYSTRPTPVEDVLFVSGSDILGPMGQELVPVLGMENAKTLLQDHGGKKIKQFVNGAFKDVFPAP